MPANEATRLRSKHTEPRAEEGSAARPLVREPHAEAAEGAALEARGSQEQSFEEEAEPNSEALAALERAAENIRPSWHGAELPPAPTESGALQASLPAALPPPPALPSFSSFPIEQAAPYYRVDTTVRTAAVLPERLAELLSQPQIAGASHWLRARPWARASLAVVAVLLLTWLFWPSAPEAPAKSAAKPKAASAPAVPAAPAPSAAREPPAPAAASEVVAAEQPEPPAVSVKKRDKRKAPAVKAATSNATAAKPGAAKVPTSKAASLDTAVKPVAAKTRKPAKAATAPAR